MKTLLKIILISNCFVLVSGISARTWTNSDGVKIEADLVNIHEDTVEIRMDANGQIYDYPITQLSEADQAYIEEQRAIKLQEAESALEREREEALANRKAKWTENYEDALAESKQYGLPIYTLFTGSDWCGYCIELEKNHLSTSQFKKYANQNLVLLKLDFPHKKQKRKLKKQNEKLQSEFKVSGFPSVFLVNAEGENLGKLGGYSTKKTDQYLKVLERDIQKLF